MACLLASPTWMQPTVHIASNQEELTPRLKMNHVYDLYSLTDV